MDTSKRQQSLDFTAAAVRADAGIKRSAKKASTLEPGWIERAVEEVRAFAKKQDPDALFNIEDVRVGRDAHAPTGADERSWGHVAKRAIKLGVIVKTNMMKEAASSNGSPKRAYRRGPHA